jgi:hypothetical protein
MSFILACLAATQQLSPQAGYASPVRQTVVIILSGIYVAIVGWWAGSKIIAAWHRRADDAEDQFG